MCVSHNGACAHKNTCTNKQTQVNVFLGLGLPWVAAAVYWAMEGRTDEWLSRPTNDGKYTYGTWKYTSEKVVGNGNAVFVVCFVFACVLLWIRLVILAAC